MGGGGGPGKGTSRDRETHVILCGLSAQLEKKDAMHKMLLSFMEYLFLQVHKENLCDPN